MSEDRSPNKRISRNLGEEFRTDLAKEARSCEVVVLRGGQNEKSHFERFEVPKSPDMSILDALLYVSGHVDSTLEVNHSCGKQRCGSCAMKVDDKIGLACYIPVKESQVISPLPGFKVVKDLVVDWGPHEKRMYELIPQEGSDRPTKVKPEAGDRAIADSAMTCIKCFACVGACPSVDFGNPRGFQGPAISVMLASYVDDPETLPGLSNSAIKAGLEFCTKCFACNAVCPAEIDIVGSINRLQEISGKEDKKGRDLLEMVQGRL